MPAAESATSSVNTGQKKKKKQPYVSPTSLAPSSSSSGHSSPPPAPTPHPITQARSTRKQYPFLRFEPGVNYQGVDPTLLQKMNTLGRTYGSLITIISGLRSHSEQRQLYAAYKNGTGNIAASPGRSYHEYGLAVDALIDGQAIGDVLPPEAFAKVGLTNLKSINDAPHVQLDEQPYVDDPSRIKFIRREAKRRNLDPDAVLAVASAEGLSGGVGDGGHAFGPFQLNDAGGVLTNAPADHRTNEWAWSDEGIRFALDHIARVAKGQRGSQAIAAIVNNFERPADPQAEIERATASYGSGVSGSYTGGFTPPAASQGFSASSSAMSGGFYAGPVTGTVDAQGNPAPDVVGAYPLGQPTLPYETPMPQGGRLLPHQLAETWDLIASLPGASPETQSLAQRMMLLRASR